MKIDEFRTEMKRCATEALEAVLSGVSTLKLREICSQSPAGGSDTGFVAYVDVLGRPHALACEVKAIAHPMVLRAALEQLRAGAAKLATDATPVLIAPYLSPEAQALCAENHAGYLDLAGNARIDIGEVFIGKRTLSNVDQPPVPAAQAGSARRSPRRGKRAHDATPAAAAA